MIDIKKGLTNSSLKLVAMFCMLADHIPWIIWSLTTNMNTLSNNWVADVMHMFGRIAFPIFAFCIAEGYRHTHNLKKYTQRVGIMALLSIIPFALVFGSKLGYIIPQNTVFTLFFGLCALYFSDKFGTKWQKSIVVFLFFILSVISDAGLSGVLGIYAFAKIKDPKKRIIIGTLLLNSLDLIAFITNPTVDYLVELIWTIVPFLVLIYFYNGKRGANVGKLFYFFYPVHLLVLGLIQVFM